MGDPTVAMTKADKIKAMMRDAGPPPKPPPPKKVDEPRASPSDSEDNAAESSSESEDEEVRASPVDMKRQQRDLSLAAPHRQYKRSPDQAEPAFTPEELPTSSISESRAAPEEAQVEAEALIEEEM